MFKIGQIVQYDGSGLLAARQGAKAVVVNVTKYPTYISVVWVKDDLYNHQSDGQYYPQYLNIIEGKMPVKFWKDILKRKLISNLEYLEVLSD